MSTAMPSEAPPISIALGISVVLVVVAVPLFRILSNSSSRRSDAMALHQEDDIGH